MPNKEKKPGLPLPVNKNKTEYDPQGIEAAKNIAKGIIDVTGPAGEVGLMSFAEGLGVDIKDVNGQVVVEYRPKGDSGLYIDGKPFAKPETTEKLRKYLKFQYSSKKVEPAIETKK